MNDLAQIISCYRDQYSQETESLFTALSKDLQKIALINPFLPEKERLLIIKNAVNEKVLGPDFYWLPKETTTTLIDGLMSHYFMDLSSVFAPLFLPIHPGDQVLDMCSAPGGKLLVMISRLIKDATFIANDISKARSLRLRKVAHNFLPKSFVPFPVMIVCKDAHYFGLKKPQSFDAILLDAPCSNESHLIKDPHLLKNFTGLSKSLPMRQYSLLASALLALKPGGHVMYATCSINQNENEGVIEKILRKKSQQCSLVKLAPVIGKLGPYGVTILPHLHGAGPAFFSLLRRND